MAVHVVAVTSRRNVDSGVDIGSTKNDIACRHSDGPVIFQGRSRCEAVVDANPRLGILVDDTLRSRMRRRDEARREVILVIKRCTTLLDGTSIYSMYPCAPNHSLNTSRSRSRYFAFPVIVSLTTANPRSKPV